tara:strand:- start:286 stop:456 length:171 start_codon:yes stop_codon:yes gene_type:complete
MPNYNTLNLYNTSNINVPDSMINWMRSDHAGETGAVWIYMSAKLIFWNKNIQDITN